MNDEFLEELEGLARIVSRMPDLVVREGKAGSGWSFNHRQRIILMDAARLRSESRNFNRGLVLHELAHAVLTRLHFHRRGDYLLRSDIHMAVGALEDARIESWLMSRFPGARPWITEYNNKLLRNTVDDMAKLPWTQLPPLESFVAAIMARWWHGPDRIRLPHAVVPLVEEAWPHVEAICKAIPGSLPCRAIPDEYRKSLVAGLYALQDAAFEPDPAEMEIRLRQGEMWDIFMAGILPILQRLAPPGRREPRRLRHLLEALCQRWSRRSCPKGDMAATPLGTFRPGSPGNPSKPSREPVPWQPDPVAYAKAVHAQRPAIERLGRVVQSVFPPERNRSWVGPRASGLRLRMRSVHQAEADPRRQSLLWERPSPPTRPRPHLAVLVDRSGSMEGARMTAAFAGCALLAEVCAGARIPFSLLTFSDACELVVTPEDALDEEVQARIGGLHRAADGGTCMATALQRAWEHLGESPCRERVLVVLGDGRDPSDEVRPVAARMTADGIHLVALGVGPDTHDMARCIDHARTGLEPKAIPGAFAAVLEQVVHGRLQGPRAAA
ncbi:MAG: VWA domain-containing protein [Verrucomicrobiota bacterium]